MKNAKKILIKIGKYILSLAVILAISFIILMTIIAEDIKIGNNDCGTYIKRQGFYNPTNCGWCLGKLVVESETKNFIDYNCIGIKFEDTYE